MQAPLIVVDTRREVTIFANSEAVVTELEAIDVVEGEYRLFDCAGREYPITAESDSSPIVIGDALPEDQVSLVRELAFEYLDRVDETRRVDRGADQSVLCEALLEYAMSFDHDAHGLTWWKPWTWFRQRP